ncbi:MAG TPA: pseudouridine-5'-phosphate glycosidase [Saprospiraceae bacterium]|nr:pseudouridine-5'-phosphate glycosidase [Saprospiraceae bacterium]
MIKIEYAPEVAKAMANGKPIVALESTIISHGMPFPKNMETAYLVEEVVRENGAYPATIAIIGGVPKIGLTEKEIRILAEAGKSVTKVSRRDFPMVLAQKKHGATTVAGTMILAEKAGIRIFATGGIGGVHRGAENTMDISADLQELANTSVAVVSAGVKSILDLGLTLEYLETMGVPVWGYQTSELPAFFTRDSGFRLDYRADDVETLAKMLKAKWDFGLKGGVLIGNPVPRLYSMDKWEIEGVIREALLEAKKQGRKGKKITPFLLSKINELTKGKSLATNIELVLNNARLAARLAHKYAEMV